MVHQGKNVRMAKHIFVYEGNGRNVGRCKKIKYVAGDNSSFDYYQHFQRTILRLDRENQVKYEKCPYALKYLAAKDYYNFKNMVAQTMGDMNNCIYDDLSTMKPVPQFFITKTNDIQEIGYFIIVL
ncbi:unnamed protein product, partial [Arabidopsis halleri]